LGFLDRLKQGLTRTKAQIVGRFEEIVQQADTPEHRARPIDVDTIEALEEVLISADVGIAATERIVTAVKSRARRNESLRELVKDEIRGIFDAVEPAFASRAASRPDQAALASGSPSASRPAGKPNGHHPHVTLIVGVNGTGKTTTVGKLANLLKNEGQQPLVCAADTFRAAAVEQLEIWAKRANVDIVRAKEGSDPAAVVFDAIQSGKARGRDPILVDTAGRLHNRVNLMNELDKIRRVAARAADGAPHDVLLVLDATVGQNGVQQAREFTNVAGVTGIVLTKLDGTAKGGVAVAIANDLRLPIRYVGVGEGIDDLIPFSAQEYIDALFQEKW
jgi:fused signal recognition particle receptor